MRNLSKYILISAAILLSFIGISRNYNSAFFITPINNADTELSILNSSENVNSIYFLHSPNENLVNFENNLTVLYFKNFTKAYGTNSYSFEINILNKINQYYTASKIIDPGLSIRDIIFPFHFFG